MCVVSSIDPIPYIHKMPETNIFDINFEYIQCIMNFEKSTYIKPEYPEIRSITLKLKDIDFEHLNHFSVLVTLLEKCSILLLLLGGQGLLPLYN